MDFIRFVCNMSMFGPDGPEVGPPTGNGIWDSNSWGIDSKYIFIS